MTKCPKNKQGGENLGNRSQPSSIAPQIGLHIKEIHLVPA